MAAAYPAAAAADSVAVSAATATLNCAPAGMTPSPCYSPQAFQVTYGVAPLLSHGIDGRGETVVVGPEPAVVPSTHSSPTDIRRSLAAFDIRFGLPAASLDVVNTFARSATPYLTGAEEVTDTEMVHAIAPDARLDVVLVPSDITRSPAISAAAITKVIEEGVALHAAVISISFGVGEHFLTRGEVAAMNLALVQARDQHVTVVDSSGDAGAISDLGPPVQVQMPASDPLVLVAGGTTLDAARPGGTYLGETAWNSGGEASGGGYSSLFPRPAYQDGLARAPPTRGVPDVAAKARRRVFVDPARSVRTGRFPQTSVLGLDTSGVDDARGGLGLAALLLAHEAAQAVADALPGAVAAPGEVVSGGRCSSSGSRRAAPATDSPSRRRRRSRSRSPDGRFGSGGRSVPLRSRGRRDQR